MKAITHLFTAAAAVILLAGCTITPKVTGTQYPEMQKIHQKLEAGETVRIAYFGGSITWGATATDPLKTSWRALLSERLQREFPKARIVSIDAAIGGKGSDLGVFRMDRDVIPYNPDLTFVEFAVNDGDKADRLECMEGIIRKLRNSNPEMAIVIVITGSGKGAFISPREEDYTRLAGYYNLPAISIVSGVNTLLAKGEITTADILTDGVHPNDRGYKLYCDIISDKLAESFQAFGKPRPRPVAPMTRNRYESARMIELGPLAIAIPGWSQATPSVTGAWFDHQPSRWLSSVAVPKPGSAEITLDLACSGIGVYFEAIPGGSSFDLLADGTKAFTANTAFSQQYPGLAHQFRMFDSGKERRITLKPNGTKLRLGYLLVTR